MLVARFLGTDWRVHPLFLVLLVLLSLSGYLPQAAVVVSVLFLHELGHITAAWLHELSCARIDIFPFGGVAEIAGIDVVRPEDDMAVAVAGPLGNLLLVALATLLQDWRIWNPALMDLFVGTNLSMAVLNLLPVLPLDGGRVLRAGLARRVGYRAGTAVLARAGRVSGWMLVLAGLSLLYTHRLDLDRLLWVGAVNAAGLGVFLILGARREEVVALATPWLAMISRWRLLQKNRLVPVCVLAGDQDLPVASVVRHLRPGCIHKILVLDRQGKQLGILSEEDLLRGLESGAATPLGRLVH